MTPEAMRMRSVIAAVLVEQLNAAPTPARRAAEAVMRVLQSDAAPSATPDREHIVTVPPGEMDGLRAWLERPNGAHVIGRVTLEAVDDGGILVRTMPIAPAWRGSMSERYGRVETPAVGMMMDTATAARLNELEQLAAPNEDGALNLGPVIERQRLATNDRHYHNDIAASQADVMPLVREVMRLRREAANRVANEPSATARSAVAGLARHIEDMRHVFAELVAATCTGCPIVANSSNPEDGADVDPRQDCPVHGEVAELRRQVSFSARAYGQIAEALGPEFTAPFGPDATLAALQCIETARGIDDVLREAGIEYPLGLRGVEDLANQRDGALEHVTELADKMAEALNYDADQNRPVADNLLDDLIKGYHERGGDVCQH